MAHVDLVVGTQNIYNIGQLLDQSSGSGPHVVTSLDDKYDIPNLLPTLSLDNNGSSPSVVPFRKFVTIMQGCNNFCTYCVVPHTRGREVSRKAKDIVSETKILVESGVKEITLLGQNVNSYGKTNSVAEGGGEYSFSNLLREVAKIKGLERLRFTTSNPKDLTDELMRCFRDVDNLCHQFHLPVQAGSDAVLKKMHRKYTVEQYLMLVEKLRRYCPDIAITTDVIIGFPGESSQDFEGTMNLLEEVQFHGSFSFKYSDRPGTLASTFEKKVDEKIKSERLARFQDRQDEISLKRNREYVGSTRAVMVEDCDGESVKSRTETNHIVHFAKTRKLNPGECVDVTITHAGQHSLQGKIKDS